MEDGLARRALRVLWIGFAAATFVATPSSALPPSYTLFESGQVRPLALSPDGAHLFVVNTPDSRLEIFSVGAGGLSPVASVPVGLEPVAVAARSDSEVWVVNHLSDSVSVVDVSTPSAPRVVRTLLVGDEPRDIVFAGPGGARAFITTAHRGQNGGFDPQFTTPGIGRADVWVFDAANLGAALGGTPLTRVVLFGDTPRALAVSPDGETVYAAVFQSGNRTTTVHEGRIPDGGEGSGGLPAPNTNHTGVVQPEAGLIVKHDGSAWRDELGRSWSSHVMFDLPDYDVFEIDAAANPPVESVAGRVAGVGTILFNMVANPVSGKLYVSNLEARNEVRFEGEGTFAGSTVRGHLAESRITVVNGTTPTSRHLNKHIDYDTCCDAVPNAENAASLAFPLEMVVTADGSTLYAAAFGSGKIGVYSTAALEADTFVPDPGSHIEVTGGGPSGLVLDEANGRLYALTRFDNSVSVIDTAMQVETAHLPLHDAEPASITNGRRFLYDASYTSAHGDSACATCHIFGDFDSLAWDLGDPDGDVLNSPGPFTVGPFGDPDFHPMKGPMTTQSLRGMANHGPMHWRGDRTGGNDATSAQPNGGAFNEDAAFKKFNGAFSGLLGRSENLTPAEMQAFTDFILQVVYPPNPVRNLDNSMTAAQQAGSNFYFGAASDTFVNCNGCHVLDPNGNAASGVARPGFFGSDGRSSFENEPQHMKVAHLRNMVQKVGMFGMPAVSFFNSGDNAHKGAQVRGFGFLHDGSTDTLFRFLNATVFNVNAFNPGGIPSGGAGTTVRRNLEAFVLAFPSNMAPVVGQQITRTSTSGAAVDTRLDLLLARANAGECDLVVKGSVAGEARGWWYSGGTFASDRASESVLTDAALRLLADTAGQELTYTCMPPGSGLRAGLDRDEDGYRDRDELDAGSDPADAASIPGADPFCGDGEVDAGEDCDDGGANSDTTPDACRTDCTVAGCGDEVTDSGEDCDDGAANSDTTADACRTDCTQAGCGDDVVDSGEQCDDGVANSDTLADACRTSCLNAHCGDDVLDAGETCDDGPANSDTAADACRTTCEAASCGDGARDSGEACDGTDFDGVDCSDYGFTNGALACSGLCVVDSSGCNNLPVCGDGVVNAPGEQCDGGDLDGLTCNDVGFTGGVLACSGGCLLDDADCTQTFSTRLLKLGGLTDAAGEQKFKLLSNELDGADTVFNPFAEDTHVEVSRAGVPVWQADIAAGDAGWKLTGSSVRWSSRSHPSGLSGLTIGLPGRPFTVKMKAKFATVTGAASAPSLEVTLTVGDDTFTGAVPCGASSNPDKLLCR